MSSISLATNNNNILNNPVGQADETKNVALGNIKEGVDGSKGIWNKVKSFAAKTGEAVKNFLFATADFLKNSGVRLGTTLGIAVGVLAVVGCIVSLPVSLPLLAGIAGTIFATGAVGKLIKNIPETEGAANVIKKTLNDIKSDVIMGTKRALKYIVFPGTIYTDIEKGIINNQKSVRGYKSNISDLKDIIDYSKADLGNENHKKIKELFKKMEDFRGKIIRTEKPKNPLTDPLEQERQTILDTLRKFYENRKNFKNIETRDDRTPFETILKSLIEKFGNDEFIEKLRSAPKAS